MSYAGGTGTELDPYLIATRQHLLNIALNTGSHFALINDVDCAAGVTNSIGYEGSTLDGRGHKIYNVFAPRLAVAPAAGLFISLEAGALIKRVHLDAVSATTDQGVFNGVLCRFSRGGTVEDTLLTGGFSLAGTSNRSAPFGSTFSTTATATRCVMSASGVAGDVFLGLNTGTRTVTDCYRTIHSGGANGASVPLIAEADIGIEASYPGLDFTNTWEITPIGPRLRKQGMVAVSGGPVVSGVTPAEYVSLVNTDTEQVYRATVAGDGTWTASVPPGNYRRISWINDPDCRTCSEIGVVS